MEEKKMKREQTEKTILRLMEVIRDVYKEYNPEGEYLTLTFMEDTIYFNNEYWSGDTDGTPQGKDYNKPIKYRKIYTK